MIIFKQFLPRSFILDADVADLAVENTFSAVGDLVVPGTVVRHEVLASDVAVQRCRVYDAL